MPDRRRATWLGFGAIALWGTLAPLAAGTPNIPPFQTTAAAFGVAFVVALVVWRSRGERIVERLRVPPRAWALGVYGLFGYHALYFAAFKLAPSVEVNLVNYLWPLLIVLFAALLPGERLRLRHVIGAAIGFAGVAALLSGGEIGFRAEYASGYAAALGCAAVWSSYSVLSRRLAHVPSDAVGGFCGATALLAALCHVAFETTVVPSASDALALVAMGLGPTGAAFLLWDIGMKRGDIQLLGAAAYAAPAISTLLLIGFGLGETRPMVWATCAAVIAGAVVAGGGFRARTKPG